MKCVIVTENVSCGVYCIVHTRMDDSILQSLMPFASLFILFAGYVVGLGAVTVIDLHGFLGRHSPYWTEATTRTHKVTKPLIWLGTLLVALGGMFTFTTYDLPVVYAPIFGAIMIILILNGLFLSFVVSPFLLAQEREGKSRNLLPRSLQRKIIVSFMISFAGWWGSFALLIWLISSQ